MSATLELSQVTLSNICKGAMEEKFQDRLAALLLEFGEWDDLAVDKEGMVSAKIKLEISFQVSPVSVVAMCSADLVPPKRRAAAGSLYRDPKTNKWNVWANEGEQGPLFGSSMEPATNGNGNGHQKGE